MTTQTKITEIKALLDAYEGPVATLDRVADMLRPAPAVLAQARIRLRYRELNAKCKGSETFRKVVDLDTRTAEWATDVAEEVQGQWYPRGIRAHERKCSQTGLLPIGAIILDIEKPTRGSTEFAVGRVKLAEGEDPGGRGEIEWFPGAHKKVRRDGGVYVHVVEVDGERHEVRG